LEVGFDYEVRAAQDAGGDRPEPQTDGEADHPPAAIRRCPCSSDL